MPPARSERSPRILRCRANWPGLRLSPAEGDAAAEYALAASARVLEAAAGKKKRITRPAETIRFGDAGHIGVTVDGRDAVPSGIASVISMVVGHLLPRIAGEVHLHRWTPPALRNTDGDEMCLITAEIAVNDSEQVSDRLAARAGFERDPNDPAHIIWYGIGIPGTQQKGMLAQAKAQLGARAGSLPPTSMSPRSRSGGCAERSASGPARSWRR